MSEKWVDRLSHLQLALVALVVLAPVAWMVLSSFKPSSEVTAYPPKLLFTATLDNYRQLFASTPFGALCA